MMKSLMEKQGIVAPRQNAPLIILNSAPQRRMRQFGLASSREASTLFSESVERLELIEIFDGRPVTHTEATLERPYRSGL